MTPRDVRAFLLDVIERTEEVRSFMATKSRADFMRERLLQSAVERQLSIIGEAVVRTIALRPEFEVRIRSCRRIIGLRNRLVHAYMAIEPANLYDIVDSCLEPLDQDVRRLLREVGE